MKLSIVSTLYCSASYIEEFCERSAKAAKELLGDDDFEIVLVNDGSPDNSLDVAVKLYESGRFPLKIVDLSRNFGHHKAMQTCCMHASGDLVYLIDVDLEEAPEWLIPFEKQLRENECDVVYGVQESRKGGWFERVSGEIFYSIFNKLTSIKVPRNITTARLMTRRYVDVLVQYQEREVFLLGLWTIAGFKQEPQTVKKLSTSPTTYTAGKKIAAVVNSVTSFSVFPLYMIATIGIGLAAVSICFMIYQIIRYFIYGTGALGWTSLFISIWFFSGVILIAIGIIGIYMSKIFMEVKQRPYVTIRKIYSRNERNSYHE